MTQTIDMVKPSELPRADHMQSIIVAFDVDGTLIRNVDRGTRIAGIPNSKDEAIERQVVLLQTLSTFKNIKIVVWSGGGREYAEVWGRRLGLDKYVWRYASKLQAKDIKSVCDVLIAIDDIQATALGDVNMIVREK